MTALHEDEEKFSEIQLRVMNVVRLVARNPFLYMTNENDLVTEFEKFSSNVVTAMDNLWDLTFVRSDDAVLVDEDVVNKNVVSYLHQSEEKGQTIELVLSSAFMKVAKDPYCALIELHQMEKGIKPYDSDWAIENAQIAMKGLKSLQLFAKVVPAVYRTRSQDQGLALVSVA